MSDVVIQDIPHSHLTPEAKAARDDLLMDLAQCNVLTIHISLGEYGKADGLRFDQWPRGVQTEMQQVIAEWQARNPAASIKAITQTIIKGVCTLGLHWRPKA